MNPDDVLQRIIDALESNEPARVEETADALLAWVHNGGLEPSDPDWRDIVRLASARPARKERAS